MLNALRIVLSTVTDRFAADVFLRIALNGMSSTEASRLLANDETSEQVKLFLHQFEQFIGKQNNEA